MAVTPVPGKATGKVTLIVPCCSSQWRISKAIRLGRTGKRCVTKRLVVRVVPIDGEFQS